jgi:hypothetical protein
LISSHVSQLHFVVSQEQLYGKVLLLYMEGGISFTYLLSRDVALELED